MGKIDWDVVTNYTDVVTTTLKTVTFPKVQEQVYLRNQGNANFTYTIGSQSGTLTPGQSVTVNQDVNSFTLQAVSGTHTFELRAKEKGTEIDEIDNNVPSDVSAQLNSLTMAMAERATKTELGDSTQLNTTDKTSVVNAIREIKTQATDAQTKANNPLNQLLDNTIPSSKLKQVTDSDKIQIANLSDAVRAAMTGTSPVGTTPADGSVTAVKIADGTITPVKLADDSQYRGSIASGVSVNTAIKSGTYLITAGALDVPTALNNATCTLTVDVINNRWLIQTIVGLGDNKAYLRTVDKGTGGGLTSVAWVSITLLDSSVTAAKLADNYNYRGAKGATDDLNTITKSGYYVYTAQASNMPTGSTSGMLIVWTSGTFIIQQYMSLQDTTKIHYRYIKPSTSEYGTWRRFLSQDDLTSIPAVSHLSGKKIVCFGDSLTEGQGGTLYTDTLASRTGATVTNVGFGGCQWTKHWDVDYDKFSMTNLADAVVSGVWTVQDTANANLISRSGDNNTTNLNKLKAIDFTTIDYITIFYGTNDFTGDVPIGTDTDDGKTSFKGAINYVIRTLLTTFPQLKILLVTPTWRARQNTGDGKDSDVYPNSTSHYLMEYVDSIINIGSLNKIPSVDMYRKSGINKYNTTYYQADGLHGTTVGYQLIGSKIASALINNY
jgi:lysophospholipase L1-like esterase